MWRISDSERNCLNQWCYYLLINSDGLSPLRAQKALNKQTIQWKNEYLFNNHGIKFDKLPSWQKRGNWNIFYGLGKRRLQPHN